MFRTKETHTKFIDFAMEAQGHGYELSLDKLTVRASYDINTFHFGATTTADGQGQNGHGNGQHHFDHNNPKHNHGKFICADRTFFCSELAAKLCKITGIFVNDERPSSSFFPKHFSSKYDDYLKFENGVSAEGEKEIVVDH